MRLTIKKKDLDIGEVFRYLGTETNLLNDGTYRTAPDIIKLIIDNKVTTFVEIGTDESRVSEILSNIFHDVSIICVNPDQENEDDQFKNLNIISETSQNAVDGFTDGTLDMVYIDDHDTYESVYKDLELWTSKVRQGGIIAGYDYHRSAIHGDIPPTVLGVEHFVDKHGFIVHPSEHNHNLYWFTKQ